jgi:hypothetical protein
MTNNIIHLFDSKYAPTKENLSLKYLSKFTDDEERNKVVINHLVKSGFKRETKLNWKEDVFGDWNRWLKKNHLYRNKNYTFANYFRKDNDASLREVLDFITFKGLTEKLMLWPGIAGLLELSLGCPSITPCFSMGLHVVGPLIAVLDKSWDLGELYSKNEFSYPPGDYKQIIPNLLNEFPPLEVCSVRERKYKIG